MILNNPSITSFGHKSWTPHDRIRLMIACNNGACLRTISLILKRSITATNKALSRFGMRTQFGSRGDMSYESKKTSPSYDQVMAAIADYEARHHIEPLNDEACIEPKPKKVTLPIFEGVLSPYRHQKPAEIYIKLKEVLQYARTSGFNIQAFRKKHYNEQGYFYLLNEKPVTNAQLLVQMNKHRIATKQPIFCIEDLTHR